MPGTQSFGEVYPLNAFGTLNDSIGTTPQVVASPAPPSYRMDQFYWSSTDAIDHVVHFGWFDGSTFFEIFNFTLPALAGQGSVPAVDMFALAPASLATGFAAASFTALAIQLEVPLTSTTTISYSWFGGQL
jgi:hypothetical protein